MISDRLLAAVAAAKLDEQLANGVSPDASPALVRRARKLLTPATRERLGLRLRQIVADAQGRAMPGPRVPLYRKQVLGAQDELRLLASRLQSPGELSVRGVAIVALLLTDGVRPAFGSPSATELERALREAVTALH